MDLFYKWLKFLWKENGWSMRFIARETGKAESSCSNWFKTGQIPAEKHWPGISRFLINQGYELHTLEHVSDLFIDQRRFEGWLVDCESCGTEFLRYAKTKKYCNSRFCKSVSQKRYKSERQLPSTGVYRKIDFTNRKHCQDHKIDREQIDHAVKEYLRKGGEITKLPTVEEGILSLISIEMMKAGFHG